MTTFHGDMNAAGLRVALVCSRFNDLIVGRLEAGARDTLVRHGAHPDAIDTVWVPGAWEIPMAAQALAVSGRYDAIVALGAVMRGATYHFEVIANQSAAGLTRVALERAGSKAGNKGADAALAAVETVRVVRAATPG